MSLVEADSLKKITVHDLKRFNLLQAQDNYRYLETALEYKTYRTVTSKISVVFNYGNQKHLYQMRLSYKLVDTDISRQTTVKVVTMPCSYGGERYIFKCPNCDRNCYKLYLAHTYFRCRICHNLTYESNNQTKRWRYLDTAFGILFAEDKPAYKKALRYPMFKGCYTNNYNRVLNKYSSLDFDKINARLEAML